MGEKGREALAVLGRLRAQAVEPGKRKLQARRREVVDRVLDYKPDDVGQELRDAEIEQITDDLIARKGGSELAALEDHLGLIGQVEKALELAEQATRANAGVDLDPKPAAVSREEHMRLVREHGGDLEAVRGALEAAAETA